MINFVTVMKLVARNLVWRIRNVIYVIVKNSVRDVTSCFCSRSLFTNSKGKVMSSVLAINLTFTILKLNFTVYYVLLCLCVSINIL